MPNKATPNILFDQNAEAAIEFYISVFENSKIENLVKYSTSSNHGNIGKIKQADIVLNGQKLVFYDSVTDQNFKRSQESIYMKFKSENDLIQKFKILLEEGKTISPMERSAFGNLSGWVQDKFGLTWHLNFQQTQENQEDLQEDLNVCFANSKEVRPEYRN